MYAKLRRFKIDIFYIFLVISVLFLISHNYTPNTILSGWDTLHPEFNMGQYFQRITSVWQEHQGLGAPPSQAHLAELPRMIIMYPLTLLLPMNMVRYAYFFLMMLLGPSGVYFFIRHVLKKMNTDPLVDSLGALIGSLFYIFNIGTMQHFVVPLEMFATKFGYLGFIYLFLLKYLENGKKKDLIWFAVIIFFATPMAHTATLWFVFFAGICLFLGTYFLLHRKSYIFSRCLTLFLLTLALNLYWLLPNLYYSFNYSNDVINSKIHRLFSEEAFYHNKDYGHVDDLLLMKNFLFNWKVPVNGIDGYEFSTSLLNAWKHHLGNIYIDIIGYAIAFISFGGIAYAIAKKRKDLIPLLPVTGIAIFFLLGGLPFIANMFEYLRSLSPTFKEALRFPFTKLSLQLIFAYAVFLGYGQAVIMDKLKKHFSMYIYTVAIIGGIFILNIPAFQGNFISSTMRVHIPSEYNRLFVWSQEQNDGRILQLPLHSLYGWIYYNWHTPQGAQLYQGAGFTWFGLKQPLLNREFDRWYPYNEENYRELAYAVNSKNWPLFMALLNKYDIHYLLFDKNVVNIGGADEQKKLFYDDLYKLLHNTPGIKLEKQFSKNLAVYSYANTQQESSPVTVIEHPPVIGPMYKSAYIDEAYIENGTYITPITDSLSSQLVYPARTMMNNQERVNPQQVQIDKKSYQVYLDKAHKLSSLAIPDLQRSKYSFYGDIYTASNSSALKIHYLLPFTGPTDPYYQTVPLNTTSTIVSINDQVLIVPSLTGDTPVYLGEAVFSSNAPLTYNSYNDKEPLVLPLNQTQINPELCSDAASGQISGAQYTDSGIEIYGRKAKVCLSIPLSDMITFTNKPSVVHLSFSYRLSNKNLSGSFCLYDEKRNKCLGQHTLKQTKNNDQTVDVYFTYVPSDSLSQSIRMSFDAVHSDKIESLYFEHVTPVIYELIDTKSIPVSLPRNNTSSDYTVVNGNLPQHQFPVNFRTATEYHFNCGLTSNGNLKKSYLSENGSEVVEYNSEDGALCESLAFPDLIQDTGYILTVQSRNISGLPLRLCLENDVTKKCDLEDELSKLPTYHEDNFLIPPYYQGSGYNLIFNNLSIGKTPTVNHIQTVSIIPIPFELLQAIYSGRNEYRQKFSQRPIEAVRKAGFAYVIPLKTPLLADTAVIFHQAYEKNWKAYIIPSALGSIPGIAYLSPLIGKTLGNHILVNNWANGWTVSPENLKTSADSTIVIFFLPQFLVWVGCAVFLGTIILLLKATVHKGRSQP